LLTHIQIKVDKLINTRMNIEDIDKMNKLRVDRLIGFFITSLQHCVIQIDTESTLSVYCPHPKIMKELLDELEDLKNHAWIILGARKVMLYYIHDK
jgi:hypothetical protein